MATGTAPEYPTVEITWPRPDGEVAIWTDLCLARALRAAVGHFLSPCHLNGTQLRLKFREWHADGDQALAAPAMKVVAKSYADWEMNLVGDSIGGRLRWSRDFLAFLLAIEKDRLSALQALGNRPMSRAAIRLGGQLGLSKAEIAVLCVLALINFDEALTEPLAAHCVRSNDQVTRVLEQMVGLKPRTLVELLGPTSTLRRLRLVRDPRLPLSDLKLSPLAPILDALVGAECGTCDPLAHFLVPVRRSKLEVTDFEHLPVPFDLLASVLRDAHLSRRAGVNLLLHGAPGTGKTELSRLLTGQVESTAFEVPLLDEQGSARSGTSRLESMHLCQQGIAQHERPLLIFDEAEDLFPSPNFAWSFLSLDGPHKGRINQILETNPVPTIWIANQVAHLDPAFLRRFEVVVEVPHPPRLARNRMLDALIGSVQISTKWRSELAELEDLAPDEIERIARIGKHLQASDTVARERVLRQVFGQVRKVAGRKAISYQPALPGHYRADLIHADVDLVEVADSLTGTRSGRLCLYGPPGSGKSAYAQHLSERLGMPLLVRRASDLIDKYIGETEKNLALAFSRATEEDAVLLIDEADSFLQDRQRAQHSWEISHVNELLTQMERFEGVLVMCTNHFDQLDAAALRRFDVKVKIDYLRTDQRLALFAECLDRYGIAGTVMQQQLARERLARLDRLTPGDFQTVLRRRRLVATDGVVGFVDALAAEQATKRGDMGRPIGFVRSN